MGKYFGTDGFRGEADLAGRDPKFAFDADFAADLPQICNYLPADSGYSADGLVEACFFGNIRASQLNMADFAKADVSGLLLCDSLRVSSSKDSLEAAFRGVELTLAARGNKTDDSVRQGGIGCLWGHNDPVATIYLRPSRYTKEFVDKEDHFSRRGRSPNKEIKLLLLLSLDILNMGHTLVHILL